MTRESMVLALMNLKGWGPKRIYDFAKSKGFDYALCEAALNRILSPEEAVAFGMSQSKAETIIADNESVGVSAISILDPRFPAKLYSGSDKCVFLYYKGDISLLEKESVSIIGTRHPSQSFLDRGRMMTRFFVKQGYCVVSGLALGCDTIAHDECIKVGGKAIAVLPSPCDNPQPSSNRPLAEAILESGGLLVSEYGTGSPVTKFNFPRRDRIQSLLSDATVIIQADDQSGTMIAAKKSIQDGKRVAALSGNELTAVHDYIDETDIEGLSDFCNWIL